MNYLLPIHRAIIRITESKWVCPPIDNMARRRKALAPKGKDEDVRIVAGFALGSILTALMILVVIIAPPATVGPSEGELAPDFSADAYAGSNWENFKLSDTEYSGNFIFSIIISPLLTWRNFRSNIEEIILEEENKDMNNFIQDYTN